jgi:ribosomal protein L35
MMFERSVEGSVTRSNNRVQNTLHIVITKTQARPRRLREVEKLRDERERRVKDNLYGRRLPSQ